MFWLLVIFAYLLGSLSFAILLSQFTGTPDPRHSGSGNAGATNMLRLAGKKLAILTLLGDLCKGLVPVLVANAYGLGHQDQAWIGVSAVIGHMLPLYFKFRGGKGVATAAGMLLGLYPPAAALGTDRLPDPHQLTGRPDCHPADPAIAGLAGAPGIAAGEYPDPADRLASSQQPA